MSDTRYFELDGSVLRVLPEGGLPRIYRAEADRWSRYDHIERFIHDAVEISEQEARSITGEVDQRQLVGAR